MTQGGASNRLGPSALNTNYRGSEMSRVTLESATNTTEGNRMRNRLRWGIALICGLVVCPTFANETNHESEGADVIPSVMQRFAVEGTEEVPDFQKHVVPMFGRLGCNGRACHGSFQGQGGFQLSLFGYDFKADHESLFDDESPRIDLEYPEGSLMVDKPTDESSHEGGKRFDAGGWEYQLFLNWIDDGAKQPETLHKLVKLHVSPTEIQVREAGKHIQLRAIAEWEDGTREDVTALCRFQTNNEQNALVDANGVITTADPGDTHVVVFYDKAVVPVPVIRPVSDLAGEKYPTVQASTQVDRLVIQKLRKLGLVPSELAEDSTFLRRVYLDLTGTLPSPQAIREFHQSEDPQKRAKVIDELLESPAYAAWWTTKLCDLTGNNSTQTNNLLPSRDQAAKDWYDWIYHRVERNVNYDEIVEGIVTAKSRRPGQSYTEYAEEMCDIYREDSDKSFAELPSMPWYWARRDFRGTEERAINFAYAFMGVRIQCAQCHKHPFDQWSKNDFDQFTKFFGKVVLDQNIRNPGDRQEYAAMLKDLGVEGRGNQLRRQLVPLLKEGKTIPIPQVMIAADPRNARNRRNNPEANVAQLLGAQTVDLDEIQDPREVLMDWLKREDNPYFATAFVNRVWSHYFGIGIVEPADDLSLANPPSNRALLEHLAQGFRESGYDMKWVHREILNSDTYQRSWEPNDTNKLDQRNFSHANMRQLPAEVAFDAMLQATASDKINQEYLTMTSGRAIAIPGTQPAGQRGGNRAAYALSIFGRSTRESNCDCDRTQEASLLQTVYRQNDQDVFAMLNRAQGGWLSDLTLGTTPQQTATQQRRLAQIESQVEQAQRRFNQLRGNEKANANQVNQARQRLRQIQNEHKRLAERIERAKDAEPTELATVVVEAYLRTVSRFPTAEEVDRSLKFIAEDDDRLNGVRGLMWALMNTKEFIVNH